MEKHFRRNSRTPSPVRGRGCPSRHLQCRVHPLPSPPWGGSGTISPHTVSVLKVQPQRERAVGGLPWQPPGIPVIIHAVETCRECALSSQKPEGHEESIAERLSRLGFRDLIIHVEETHRPFVFTGPSSEQKMFPFLNRFNGCIYAAESSLRNESKIKWLRMLR